MTQTGTTLTREELYEHVWSEPVSRLAPEYGLSDVGLAKICREMRIPLPGRGYWQQKAAGKKVRRPMLPPLPDGSPQSLRNITFAPPEVRTETRSEPDAVAEQRQYESSPGHRIAVPEQLEKPHPLVERTRVATRRLKPDHRGIVTVWDKQVLDIQVTQDLMERALRIMDALLKALEQRAYSVCLSQDTPTQTWVKVHGQEVSIRLDEPVRQVKRQPPPRDWMEDRYTYTPSGELRFQTRIEYFGHKDQRTWRDGKSRRLEDVLNEIVIGIVAAAEQRRENILRFERAQEESRQAQLRSWERLRKQEEEQARTAELERNAAAWAKSQQIREFVAAVRERISEGEDPADNSEGAERWLTWALEHAERLDPLFNDRWIQRIKQGP